MKTVAWWLRCVFFDAGDGFSWWGRSRHESRALWLTQVLGVLLGVGAGVFYFVGPWALGLGWPRPAWVNWMTFPVQWLGLGLIFVPVLIVDRRQRREVDRTGGSTCPNCLHDLRGIADLGECPECRFAYRVDGLRANWDRRYRKLGLLDRGGVGSGEVRDEE